jgi:hypothetical protein
MIKQVALLYLLVIIVEFRFPYYLPPTTIDVVATCSATARIPSAGSYTFPYQQSAETFTLTVPERTMSLAQEKVVLLIPISTPHFAGPAWPGTITTSCAAATNLSIAIDVAKASVVTCDSWVVPAD